MKKILRKIIVALLQLEARLVLKKYRPKIVAITGSVGKTSTKDAIYTVLATSFFVRKSSKSFNSEIGVPLTILGLQNAWNNPFTWFKNILDGLTLILLPHKYPKWLVVEVGADRPGDIQAIASWLRPDVAVVTRLSDVPVHVEFFSSAEQVRHEKSQLVLAAGKKSTVILNSDDKLVSSFRPLAKGQVVTYGFKNSADVFGTGFSYVYNQTSPFFPVGISFQVEVIGKTVSVECDGVLGQHQMSTILSALAVGKVLGIDLEKSVQSLQKHSPPPGRMRILSGVNNSCLIDDTYNSSPVAANEALETLGELKCSGQKIAVLGDMLELGRHTREAHEKLGRKAIEVADEIYTVGTRAKTIAEAAIHAGFSRERVHIFHDSVSAGEALRTKIGSGDIVLVKGSQGVRMEKIVSFLLAEPDRAEELLVRQEEEWRKRN